MRALLSDKIFSTLANVFYKKDAEREVIAKNGLQLIKAIYKCKKDSMTLNWVLGKHLLIKVSIYLIQWAIF